MSVEPKASFSSVMLKAKKKENKPTYCIFPLGSGSEYRSFLRCAQVMVSRPAQGHSVLLQQGLVPRCSSQPSVPTIYPKYL